MSTGQTQLAVVLVVASSKTRGARVLAIRTSAHVGDRAVCSSDRWPAAQPYSRTGRASIRDRICPHTAFENAHLSMGTNSSRWSFRWYLGNDDALALCQTHEPRDLGIGRDNTTTRPTGDEKRRALVDAIRTVTELDGTLN